jgi:large subunit ribosomal protein L25
MNTVEVSCKAKDLPEFIEVDVADLDVNGVIHLSDLKLPKGLTLVELTHGEDHDQSVVSIHRRGGAAEEEGEEGAEA